MSVIINFKTDQQVKKEAQKIAKEMGISLSAVLNMYLTKFVREKKVNISIDSWNNLTEESKKAVSEAEKDDRAGRLKTYSPKEAIEFAKAVISE